MKKKFNGIPKEVLTDEAVRFISERHHTTVKQVLEIYEDLEEDGNRTPSAAYKALEENELQIIHDLIQLYENENQSK